MIVCGLDLSLTNAGIAVLTDGRPTLLRSVGHGGHNGASHAHRSRRIVSQSNAVIDVLTKVCSTNNDTSRDMSGIHNIDRRYFERLRLDLAVIEDQLEHGPMLPSALDRSALWWGVYSALAARKIPIVVMNPSTLKLWTTGKGNATKHQMLEMVRSWYCEPVANHDIGDALALATVGAFHLGEPMPFVVKERHATALEKVVWPVSV